MNKAILKRVLMWVGIIVVLILVVVGAAIIAVKNQASNTNSVATLTPPISAADHYLGNSNATTTLVEYADFQCPACEAYYPLLKQLTTDYQSKVKFVYRYFPLSQHANAMPTALAAEAAGDQGKFWEMHDLLFEKHAEWGNASDPTSLLIGYAKQLNLDITKFQADMNSTTTKSVVEADLSSATAENLPGTPSFFINGSYISNPQSYQDFKNLLDNALAKTQ